MKNKTKSTNPLCPGKQRIATLGFLLFCLFMPAAAHSQDNARYQYLKVINSGIPGCDGFFRYNEAFTDLTGYRTWTNESGWYRVQQYDEGGQIGFKVQIVDDWGTSYSGQKECYNYFPGDYNTQEEALTYAGSWRRAESGGLPADGEEITCPLFPADEFGNILGGYSTQSSGDDERRDWYLLFLVSMILGAKLSSNMI